MPPRKIRKAGKNASTKYQKIIAVDVRRCYRKPRRTVWCPMFFARERELRGFGGVEAFLEWTDGNLFVCLPSEWDRD